MMVCEGAWRLRLRNGLDREEPMQPGDTVALTVPLWPTSIVFNRGHRLRVHVASSSSPALEMNRQNGQPPRTGDPRRAELTVSVGRDGSQISLPVGPPAR